VVVEHSASNGGGGGQKKKANEAVEVLDTRLHQFVVACSRARSCDDAVSSAGVEM